MWGAAELGLAVDRRDVGGRFGGTDRPEFRAMNPFGLVPVLEDGETVLFESAAILRYLLGRYGPGEMSARPQDDMWAEWAKNKLARAFILDVFWPYYRTPEAQRDMAAVSHAQRQFEEMLGIAMAAREGEVWIGGDRPGLADIWVGHVLFRYFTLDLARVTPNGAEEFYAALTARETYQRHVMVDYSELKARTGF